MLYQLTIHTADRDPETDAGYQRIETIVEAPAAAGHRPPTAVLEHAENLARHELWRPWRDGAVIGIVVAVFQPQRVGFANGNTDHPTSIELTPWTIKREN